MTVDITSLDYHQLEELIESAKQQKLRIAEEHIAKVRTAIHALLESEGLTLADVFVERRKAPRSSSAQK